MGVVPKVLVVSVVLDAVVCENDLSGKLKAEFAKVDYFWVKVWTK